MRDTCRQKKIQFHKENLSNKKCIPEEMNRRKKFKFKNNLFFKEGSASFDP